MGVEQAGTRPFVQKEQIGTETTETRMIHFLARLDIIDRYSMGQYFGVHSAHRHDKIPLGTVRLERELGIEESTWTKATEIENVDLDNIQMLPMNPPVATPINPRGAPMKPPTHEPAHEAVPPIKLCPTPFPKCSQSPVETRLRVPQAELTAMPMTVLLPKTRWHLAYCGSW